MQKNSNYPLVSTLICTYNAEVFFDATIRSVLDQTCTHQEILIRDDGSTDETVELLQKRSKKDDRIRLFIEPWVKRGPYGGLNFLLDHAKWRYIAIQDHDDIRHPEKLEKQVDFLEENNEYEGCGTYTIFRYESNNNFIKQTESYHKSKDIPWHTSLVFRNKDEIRYDTSIDIYTDYYFMNKILWALNIVPVYACVHRYRADKWNVMNSRSDNIFARLKQMYASWYELHSDAISYLYTIYNWMFPKISIYLSEHVFSHKKRKEQKLLVKKNNQNLDLDRLHTYIWKIP